jgi:hypothetical protein
MFPEGLNHEVLTVKATGEKIIFDPAKHELVEARSFPGPEYQGDLEILMRDANLIVVEAEDPKIARGIRLR